MKEIVIATKNMGKVWEIAMALADLPVKVLSLAECGEIAEAVEDGSSFQENALIKARYYAACTGKACLADDSGLEVDALHGAPGIYSARYAGEAGDDTANNLKLLKELTGVPDTERGARFRCVLAFADAEIGELTADGVCSGIIAHDMRGSGGFGYDCLFYVPELNKTMAEITAAEKQVISHRGEALRQMAKLLGGYLK